MAVVIARSHRAVMAVLAVLALGASLTGCRHAQQAPLGHTWAQKNDDATARHPWLGKVRDVRSGQWLDNAALRARLQASRVVLLGERHDNPDHHALQAKMVSAMVKGTQPSVVWEMFETTQQPVLDLAHSERWSPQKIAEETKWEKSGWPEFPLYQPVFEVTQQHGLPLRAGNAPKEFVRTLAMNGPSALPPESKTLLEDRPLPPDALERLKKEMVESHCNHLPMSMLEGFLVAQRMRDVTLARTLHDASKDDRGTAVLIAGAGHTRKDHGVPFYLEGFGVRDGVLALGFVELDAQTPADEATLVEGAEYPYDVVVFTPPKHREDPCIALMKRFAKPPPTARPAAPEAAPGTPPAK